MMRKMMMIAVVALIGTTGFAQKKSDYKALEKEHADLKKEMEALRAKNEQLTTMYTKGFDTENQVDMVSYAYGMTIGENFKNQGLTTVNLDAVQRGLAAALEGRETEISSTEAQSVINTYMSQLAAERAAKAKVAGEAFLQKNAEREEVKVTASGLQYEVIKEGTGNSPSSTSKVTVHYEGTTIDGNVFDSSKQRGQPATFGLNQVIKGWTEGLQLMKPGGVYKFYIPSDLAYGNQGAGNVIGPGETLIFDVELISIQ